MSRLAVPSTKGPTQLWEPAAPPPNAVRFTLEQYHQMIDAGIFVNDDHFELLDGFVVHTAMRSPRHNFSMNRLDREMHRRVSDRLVCRQHCGMTLANSEIEPDLCVAVGPLRRYVDHHPGKDEVRLVAEVADSTLSDDRGIKLRIYADAGLPEYWVVNLVNRQIEVYTDPTGPDVQPTYRIRRDFRHDGRVPVVLDGETFGEIAVSDIIAG